MFRCFVSVIFSAAGQRAITASRVSAVIPEAGFRSISVSPSQSVTSPQTVVKCSTAPPPISSLSFFRSEGTQRTRPRSSSAGRFSRTYSIAALKDLKAGPSAKAPKQRKAAKTAAASIPAASRFRILSLTCLPKFRHPVRNSKLYPKSRMITIQKPAKKGTRTKIVRVPQGS